MGELHWYPHHEQTTSEEAAKTSETLEYLEACNLSFERGFLSHDRIRGINSDIIKNINKGYHYFSGWLTDLIEHGMYMLTTTSVHISTSTDPQFPHTSNTQKEFLSWQSKYLLRLHAYLLC